MRARCAQRGGLGWAAGLPVFRLEGVLRFSGRRGRPLYLSEVAIPRSPILRESSSLWQVSQTILCEAPATRTDIGSPTGHAQE